MIGPGLISLQEGHLTQGQETREQGELGERGQAVWEVFFGEVMLKLSLRGNKRYSEGRPRKQPAPGPGRIRPI